MASVTVRQSLPEDVPDIRRIARRGWEAAYGDFLAAETIERAMDEWYAGDTIHEQITRGGDVAHFVAVGEGIVGYVGGGNPRHGRPRTWRCLDVLR